MKIRMIFSFIFSLSLVFAFGQLKVMENGDIAMKNTSIIPRAPLDMFINTLDRSTAQFGSFGLQSFSFNNGLLVNNGFWNGSGMEPYAVGSIPFFQFYSGGIIFRATPILAAGASTNGTAEITNFIHCVRDNGQGRVGINTIEAGNPPPGSATLYVRGNAVKTSGGTLWELPSDKRLKQNITTFKDGLDIVLKMNVVEYEYNGKAGTKAGDPGVGIIAQEIQELAPYMVSDFVYTEPPATSTNTIMIDAKKQEDLKKTTYLKYNGSALSYILVNAVKEQQAEIEKQQAQIEKLIKEIEILKEKVK